MKVKYTILLTLIFACTTALLAQPTSVLTGAYRATASGVTTLWLFTPNYSSQIIFKEKEYIGTKGGPYQFDGKTVAITVEYNDQDSAEVGNDIKFKLTWAGKDFNDNTGLRFVKQPSTRQALDGLWRITDRKQGEEFSKIPRSDRKTIKLLVDGYFQWIAINPAIKGFYGTGGGQYTFQGGDYTEHIRFFSRDNSRVGNHLPFKGELKSDQWHHSGKSSKGDPIYEIWSRD